MISPSVENALSVTIGYVSNDTEVCVLASLHNNHGSIIPRDFEQLVCNTIESYKELTGENVSAWLRQDSECTLPYEQKSEESNTQNWKPFRAESNEIAIRWHVDDLLELAEEEEQTLSIEEAREILKEVSRNHDAMIGINWSVLQNALQWHLGANHDSPEP